MPLIASYVVGSNGDNADTLTSPAFTPTVGELLVVKLGNQDDDDPTVTGVTGGGLAWNLAARWLQVDGNFADAWIYTARVNPLAGTGGLAAAPALAASYAALSDIADTTALTSAQFTPQAGELLVVKASVLPGTNPLLSGGGLNWTLRASATAALKGPLYVYTATVPANPTAMRVSLSADLASKKSLIVERWANATLATTPVTLVTAAGPNATSATPTFTTAGGDSAVSWAVTDWNENGKVDPATTVETMAAGNTQEAEGLLNGYYALWYGYVGDTDAAGPKTIGMSPRAGRPLDYQLVAIEIQSAGAAAGTAPDITRPTYQEMAFELTSSVDFATLDWTTRYAAIANLNDNRGYTGGVAASSSGGGGMLGVVNRYTQIKPGNDLAGYLDALTTLSGEGVGPNAGTRADALLGATFRARWAADAAADPLFRQAQRDWRGDNYWNPALTQALADGVGPLGLAIHYDIAITHRGTGAASYAGILAAARAAAPPPSSGAAGRTGSESAYLTALVNARETQLTAAGLPTGRVAMHRALIATGNFALTTPFSWTVNAGTYTISAPPITPEGGVGGVGSPTAPMAVASTWSAAENTGYHGMIVERWTGADVAAAPATNPVKTGSGVPAAPVSLSDYGSAVTWVDVDWNSVGGTPAARGVDGEIIAEYSPGGTYLAPFVSGRARGAQTADATTHPITLPAGIALGEQLTVLFCCDGAATVSVPAASGWAIYQQLAYGTTHTSALLTKRATGVDALTVSTDSAQQSTHVSHRITNGQLVEAAATSGAAGGGSTTTTTVKTATVLSRLTGMNETATATHTPTVPDPPGSTATQVTIRSSSKATGTATNGIAVPRPAGLVAGDYLVAWQSADADTTTLTAPTGFAAKATNAGVGGSNIPPATVWGKVATAADVAAATFAFGMSGNTNGGGEVVMLAIPAGAYDPTTPLSAPSSWTTLARTSAGSAQSPQTVVGQTADAADLVLYFFAADANANQQTYPGTAGSMTLVDYAQSTDGYALGAVYSQAIAATGATGTQTVTPTGTSTSNGWATVSVQVNAAPAAAAASGAGQALLVWFCNDAASITASTTATGWQNLGTIAQGTTTNHRGTLFYTPDASTAAALVVTLSAAATAAWASFRLSGTGTPVVSTAASAGANVPSVITPPALTGLSSPGGFAALALIAADSSTDTAHSQSVTWPAGWVNTQARLITATAGGTSAPEVFTAEQRFATGTTSITPGQATTSVSEQLVAFTVAFPDSSTSVTTPGGGGGAATPPTLTPTGGALSRLWIAGLALDTSAAATQTLTVPGGFGTLTQATPGPTTDSALAATAETTSAAATLQPGTWGATTAEEWIAWTIAVTGGNSGAGGTMRMYAGMNDDPASTPGPKTVGMTAPTGQAWTLVAIELLASPVRVTLGYVDDLEELPDIVAGRWVGLDYVDELEELPAPQLSKLVSGPLVSVADEIEELPALTVTRLLPPLDYVEEDEYGSPLTVTKIVALGYVVEEEVVSAATAGGTSLSPITIIEEVPPLTVGFGGVLVGRSPSRRGAPPVVRRGGLRVMAQSIITGEWLHRELPVSDLALTRTLSGPQAITGTFAQEITDLRDVGLMPWGTWIHVEEGGQIQASGILLPGAYAEDGSLELQAEGPSAYAARVPFTGEYTGVQVDPAAVVRMLWAHVQSFPRGNLGVAVEGTTTVRIGYPESPEVKDPVIAGEKEAAKAIIDALADSTVTVGPDWTWTGCPDAVTKWHNGLILEFTSYWTAQQSGGTGTPTTPGTGSGGFGALVDGFTGSLSLWPASSGASIVDGRARLTCDTGANTLRSARSYKLPGSALFARLTPPSYSGATATATLSMAINAVAAGTSLAVIIDRVAGTIRFASLVGGVDAAAVSISYDPYAHAFVRISEAGGLVTWATSPSGLPTSWVTRRTVASPAWVGTDTCEAQFITHRDAGVADVAEIDYVNVVPTAGAGTALALWKSPQSVDTYPQLAAISAVPHAAWVGNWITTANVTSTVAGYATSAVGATMALVIYAIPNRDSGGYSAGGFPDQASYLAWVRAVAAGVGSAPAWYILEPDALGLANNLAAAVKAERLATLGAAVTALKTGSRARVYIDASLWLTPTDAAALLISANVAACEGFATNVSAFNSLTDCYAWADQVVNALAVAGQTGKHYVIDTSRAGRGPLTSTFGAAGTPWLTANKALVNPPGRGLGPTPRVPASRPNCHALLWIKPAGESDGNDPGSTFTSTYYGENAPAAGVVWVRAAQNMLSFTDPADLLAPGTSTTGPAPTPAPIADGNITRPVYKEMALQIGGSTLWASANGRASAGYDWTGDYDRFNNAAGDRGYVAGIAGFDTATGSMLALVNAYNTASPNNALTSYTTALQTLAAEGRSATATARATALLGNAFRTAWTSAAGQPGFRTVQEAERDRQFFTPALTQAQADGVGPLGLVIHYLTVLVAGPGSGAGQYNGLLATARSATTTPAKGGDETNYLRALLAARAVRSVSARRPVISPAAREAPTPVVPDVPPTPAAVVADAIPPDELGRRSYIVGARKAPHAARTVAHAVITPEDDRGFLDMIGADTADGDDEFPIGAHTTYRVLLTDAEAARFRAADNCRYVTPDVLNHPHAGSVSAPAASTMAFMRAAFPRVDQFSGAGVLIAICDSGTTAAVRSYLGVTLAARKVHGPADPGADGVTGPHGCEVAGSLFPPGSRVVDALITDANRLAPLSATVAAWKWCADQGAKVVNYSYGGLGPGGQDAYVDGFNYLGSRGVQLFISMGNDGLNQAANPAGYAISGKFAHIHTSIAYDEQTGLKASFTNYTADASGCAPGVRVLGMSSDTSLPLEWNGTSASSPHMAALCAMGTTGGKYTAAQVGAALKAHTRDLGRPKAEQGGGAYSLEAALSSLGAFNNLPAPPYRQNLTPNPSVETDVVGYSIASKGPTITASPLDWTNTIATPFGGRYLFSNVNGNGTLDATHVSVEALTPTAAGIVGGRAYTFSVHSRYGLVGPWLTWSVQWLNDAGTVVATSDSTEKAPLLSAVWARYSYTATAPAGATKVAPRVRLWGVTNTGVTPWRLDALMIEQGATLGTYLDSSTINPVAGLLAAGNLKLATPFSWPVSAYTFSLGAAPAPAPTPGTTTAPTTDKAVVTAWLRDHVLTRDEVITPARSPYLLHGYELPLIGKIIDDLGSSTPFEFVEEQGWVNPASKQDVYHRIRIGAPQLGARLDLNLTQGENILEHAPFEEGDDVYADSAFVQGKGEGADAVTGYAGVDVPTRLRMPLVITDRTIAVPELATARAHDAIAQALASVEEIAEVAVNVRHENSLWGTFDVGDEVLPRVRLPWLGFFAQWHRITQITYAPDKGTAKLKLSRRDAAGNR